MSVSANKQSAPLTDAIIVAISKLVDDAQAESYREPSHSEIQTQIDRAGLTSCDPNQQGQTLGKAKRIRAVLYWAIENDAGAGGTFVCGLLGHVRGCGGFRQDSPNYVGADAIRGAVDAFSTEGLVLGTDGILTPRVLEGLSGNELTMALDSYVRRAKKGVTDAAQLRQGEKKGKDRKAWVGTLFVRVETQVARLALFAVVFHAVSDFRRYAFVAFGWVADFQLLGSEAERPLGFHYAHRGRYFQGFVYQNAERILVVFAVGGLNGDCSHFAIQVASMASLIFDSRDGFGRLYRRSPRRVDQRIRKARVHQAVVDRAARSANRYQSPLGAELS